MRLITAAQMREIDRVAIQERRIDAFSLMDAAGRAVALDVAEHFQPGSVAILCGKGNNGGDGYVAARYLAKAGWKVSVLCDESPSADAGSARTAWNQLPDSVIPQRIQEVRDLTDFLSDHDVAIDAILGTGSAGKPRAPWDHAITALNAAKIPIFAVDIPSGLNPDTGEAEIAVRAFRTITIGLAKIGMVIGKGPACCGTVKVEHLHFPKDLIENAPTPYHTLTTAEAARLLPYRPHDGHKGTFGLLLLAAGSEPMPGAAVLAGIGALRGGCGLVRMLTPEAIRPVIGAHLPEVILSPEPAGKTCLEAIGGTGWMVVLEKARALAIGPGIGKDARTRAFLKEALQSVELPTVLDADALNLLAEDGGLKQLLGPRHVLTPHPGELSSLMKNSIDAIQKDRWSAAREASRLFGCTVVLKGYGTIVAEPDGTLTHIGSGNTAWARGGSGDVLTGLIGSLLAQGATPGDAAKLGAFVHGVAADLYLRDHSARGALTRDVAGFLPLAFRQLETHLRAG